ncbi:hypothetical protein J5069_15505 [Candidatus Symbiopectobacterium sp. NZEC127]|uniref:hypothetical protein n=1 Tax=Candidatus Symbiopectobacterium sp. NZEC127 TaxID=2820472 RepID=UPI0022274140|nr:hypothetical protein [Candidatus Symbiopectobacterium sp. NZEC127]MCW2487304.1 hypothetical protein [Candidatus Symbiopectobacterium sp. NZEC127]
MMKIHLLLTGCALAAAFGAGWSLQGIRWEADIAARDKQSSELRQTQQQSIIAQQAFTFQRVNQIAADAYQHSLSIKADSDEKQIIYRTTVKRDPVGRQCVPDAVSGRLLDDAHRLRASVVHSVSPDANAAGRGAATADCRLTYAQAVYWIEPLLAALEQANNQLDAIRTAQADRK